MNLYDHFKSYIDFLRIERQVAKNTIEIDNLNIIESKREIINKIMEGKETTEENKNILKLFYNAINR